MAQKVATPVVIGLLGVTAYVVASLAATDWDPTLFTAFGEADPATREFAEERLGEVFLRPSLGHDGRFFFVQANDPWIFDSENNARVLDRPLYRSQRMLYPVLAGGGGLFGPEQIVWAMIVVSVLAVGAGTFATSMVATRMGISAWWGLAFAFNLGFLMEISIGGAGVVAGAAAFGAVAAIQRERHAWALTLLSLSVLAREAMLIAAVGCAWWLSSQAGERRRAVLTVLLPGAAAVLWAIYLRLRIGLEAGADQVEEIGLPFVGFTRAVGHWLAGDPLSLATGVVILLILLAYVYRTLLSGQLVGWAFLLFTLLGVMFTEQVWRSYFDISRAVAPVLTAYVLLIVASRHGLVARPGGQV